MPFLDDFGVKERVKQATDIVELIGRYMTLRRQGRNFVGICPWHDDSRPSLQINPERQSWKCWVCNIGGDCFSFLMQMDGLSFPEALQRLADDAGIPIYHNEPNRFSYGSHSDLSHTVPSVDASANVGNRVENSSGFPANGPRDSEFTQNSPLNPSDKKTLFRVAAWAENEYHRCLLDAAEAEPARRYLTERGISAESIEKFRLGYTPNDWNWIERRGVSKRYTAAMLTKLGLLVQPEEPGKRAYDRFRGRVLFPIHDAGGRSIAMGGRILPESGSTSPAKYINSPETPLFRKSHELYGLDLARSAIRREKNVLVMEGYTDVILAHQYGCDHAVAVLGTALNEQHIRILKRYTDRIILVLDGDAAGQRRAGEVLEYFISSNVDTRIATLPNDLDPAEFLVAHGGDAFRAMLEKNTLDALDHAFVMFTRDVDPDDVNAVMKAIDRILELVAKAPRLSADTTVHQRLREDKILQRLASRFRLSEQNLRARVHELRNESARTARLRTRRWGKSSDDAERNGLSRGRTSGHEELGGDGITKNIDSSDATAPAQKLLTIDTRMDATQRELLEFLVATPEQLPKIRAVVWSWQIRCEACRLIFDRACALWDEGIMPDFQRLMLVFDQPEIQSLVISAMQRAEQKAELRKVKKLPEEVLALWLVAFQNRVLEQEQQQDLAMLRQPNSVKNDMAMDADEQFRILEAMLERKRALQQFSPYAAEDEKRLQQDQCQRMKTFDFLQQVEHKENVDAAEDAYYQDGEESTSNARDRSDDAKNRDTQNEEIEDVSDENAENRVNLATNDLGPLPYLPTDGHFIEELEDDDENDWE